MSNRDLRMTRKQKSTEGKRVIYNHVNVNRHKYARGSEINLLCVCVSMLITGSWDKYSEEVNALLFKISKVFMSGRLSNSENRIEVQILCKTVSLINH